MGITIQDENKEQRLNLDRLIINQHKRAEMLPYGDALIWKHSFYLSNIKRMAIGIDPGQVHMGLAIIGLTRSTASKCTAFEIKFPSKQGLVDRVTYTVGLLEYLFASCLPNGCDAVACVEQAAFGAPFGQAALAESRTAAVMSLLGRNIQPMIIPPATIRKGVFGSGKQKAEEFKWWADLDPNAASALACAFYAYEYSGE